MNLFHLRNKLDEKTLTPAEMKKREEVAMAIEKSNPGMPMGVKMAIATKTAKRVAEDKDPCWDSHKMVGTKKKGGKTVPNCVPKESVQKKGPAGQLKGTDKVDVKGTVLGSKEKSQKGLRGKLVGGST